MSWLQKLLPPKIKRSEGSGHKTIPEGLWSKCPACEAVLYTTDLKDNQGVCPKCHHHHRLNARDRLDLLLDPEGRHEIGTEVLPVDMLKFKDSKRYTDRLLAANNDADETDAMVVMQGAIKSQTVVVACFEFNFMGGSMGSVVGERFTRGVKAAIENQCPFIALIGFAGPRVIEQTVREKLPEGFQRAEFLLQKGAIDMIVDRRELRDKLSALLTMLLRVPAAQ